MLEEMVASVMKKTLAQDFPHLKLPAAVFATIDSAAKSDAFDIEELIVHNEVTGEVFKRTSPPTGTSTNSPSSTASAT